WLPSGCADEARATTKTPRRFFRARCAQLPSLVLLVSWWLDDGWRRRDKRLIPPAIAQSPGMKRERGPAEHEGDAAERRDPDENATAGEGEKVEVPENSTVPAMKSQAAAARKRPPSFA